MTADCYLGQDREFVALVGIWLCLEGVESLWMLLMAFWKETHLVYLYEWIFKKPNAIYWILKLVIYKIATGKLKKGVLSPYYNNKTYNYENSSITFHDLEQINVKYKKCSTFLLWPWYLKHFKTTKYLYNTISAIFL